MAGDDRTREFRTLLTRVAEQLTQEELQSLSFIHSLPPAAEETQKRSALEVLVQLEKRGEISISKVQPLKDLLSSVHRNDVITTCGVSEYEDKYCFVRTGSGTIPVQKYTSRATEVTNRTTCMSTSAMASSSARPASSDKDQGLELNLASEGEWWELPGSIPQYQEQEAPSQSPPPPQTRHGSLPGDGVELQSLSIEQKQQVVEAVLKDSEMKAQVLSSLQPELLHSLGTCLGGKHSPLHSHSEGELSHSLLQQPLLSSTAEQGKPTTMMCAQQSVDASSPSSATSGISSTLGSLSIGSPSLVQQSSADSNECSSSSVSSTYQLTSQSSAGSEDCYDVVSTDEVTTMTAVRECAATKFLSAIHHGCCGSQCRKAWRLKREMLCKSIFSHKQKCYSTDLSMKAGGAKVKIGLKLYPNGLRDDTNNAMTLGILTESVSQVQDTAMINLTLLTRIGPENQEEFLSSKELKRSLGNFVVYDFMPHEVMKRCHAKYVEIIVSARLVFDKDSCQEDWMPKKGVYLL